MEQVLQQLRDIAETPWNPIRKEAFIGTLLLISVVCYFANTEARWVPILDSANLLFHEAGHPIFGLFSSRLMVYGGTLGQCFFPLVATFQFWQKRAACSFALSLVWLFENFWNIDRYMADARAQVLPLVGGGEHDWTEIFSRWNVLNQDTVIAQRVHGLAWLGVVLTCAWLWHRFKNEPSSANESQTT